MNCYLYQLQFNTPVHFGGSDSALSLYSSEDHFRADTLFSALCHTAMQMHGAAGPERLLNLARSGGLVLSDSMPWQGEQFYLPKPCYTVQTERELPADKRKVIKKLAWIPVAAFDDYCSAMTGGTFFECAPVTFGHAVESTKAAVPDLMDAKPFPVGLYRFNENAGLYFLAMCEDDVFLSELVTALGYSGIGGKVTAGYGKFTVVRNICLSDATDEQGKWLRAALGRSDGRSMLLTSSLPGDGELEPALEGACYQLIRRAGFIGADGTEPRKKKTQHFLAAGSVVCSRFEGELYEVGQVQQHAVYRYSKPMFLEVKL